jgi:hypothetical protein
MNQLIKIFKKFGIFAIFAIIICLLAIYILTPIDQKPLVQLSQEVVDKFLVSGVRNIVFFDKNAKPIQILDLSYEKPPQVRSIKKTVSLIKGNKMQINHSKSLASPLKDQVTSLKNPFISVAGAKELIKQKEALVSLPKDQVLSLLKKEIFYLEYRGDKDQQIEVLELRDDGICVKCLLASLPKSPYQNNLPLKENESSLMNFIISEAQACHNDCGCTSGDCKNVSGSCCNCRK